MTSDRDRTKIRDDVAEQDNRAAAAEAEEIERDDNLVNEEAAGDEVTIPPSAAIDPPGPIPSDGV